MFCVPYKITVKIFTVKTEYDLNYFLLILKEYGVL